MFQFLSMIDNYDQRKVGRYDNEDGTQMVSTAMVNDGEKPFETAFMHPDYNDGSMVIVESYDSKQEAIEGHEKWLKIMKEGPLPDTLTDCTNAEIGRLAKAIGCETEHKKAIRQDLRK